jgi:diguanylate cyclase (GGDEF)-like protein
VSLSPAWYQAAAAAGWAAAASAVTVALYQSRQHAALLAQARADTCTGLLAKGEWRRLAEAELDRGRRAIGPLALAMIDIDHFKQVNDRFGHLAGDQVLTAVATVIGSRLRPYDLAGRFGGDEIVLLLPGTTAL